MQLLHAAHSQIGRILTIGFGILSTKNVHCAVVCVDVHDMHYVMVQIEDILCLANVFPFFVQHLWEMTKLFFATGIM